MIFRASKSIVVLCCVLSGFAPTRICASRLVVDAVSDADKTSNHSHHATEQQQRHPEAWTLDGEPLYAPKFHGLVGAGLDAQLAMARNDLRKPPTDDPAKHVWLGRRLAYKWLYQESLVAYTKAIHHFPNDPPLRRHRGHVYISTRNFTKAETDLELASYLIIDSNDEWEPDGKPNKYNLPLYSRNFNIYYHLGLSRYLQGNYTGAVEAYDHLFLESITVYAVIVCNLSLTGM